MLNKIKSFLYFNFNEIFHLLNSLYITKNFDSNIVFDRYMLEYLLNKNYTIKKIKQDFFIQYNGIQVYCRKNSSDFRVFQQIILNEEYKSFVSKINDYNIKVENIVDCGANIGLSSIFIGNFYKDAKLYCIEPDSGNFSILQKNIALNFEKNTFCINKGIWSKDSFLKINNNFRDGNNWSLTVEEVATEEESEVEGISLNSLMSLYNLEEISILKIDIEGSERYLFENEELISKILKKTKSIAIEIHDEYGIRKKIEDILKNNQFALSHTGELTIGINKILNT